MFTYLPALLHEPASHYERRVSLPSPSILIGKSNDSWLEKPNLPEVGEIVDGEAFAGYPIRRIYMDHNKQSFLVKDNSFAGCIIRWRKRNGAKVEIRNNRFLD